MQRGGKGWGRGRGFGGRGRGRGWGNRGGGGGGRGAEKARPRPRPRPAASSSHRRQRRGPRSSCRLSCIGPTVRRPAHLYFPADPTSELELFGEADEQDNLDNPHSRRSILARLNRFLSVTQLVRNVVREPADIVEAQHTLHLPFKSLTTAPDPETPAPFDNVFNVPKPELVLDCLAHLAHEELLDLCPPAHSDTGHTAARLVSRRLRVRIHDREVERPSTGGGGCGGGGGSGGFMCTPMCDLKADKIGKIVVIKGAVIRASSLRPFVEAMPLECPRCNQTCLWPLPDGRYKPPLDGCPMSGCRVKALVPNRSAAVTRDFQKLTLQETPDDGMSELYGRVPRTVDVELLDDLVDSCVPGDQVKVVGVVKSVEVATDGGGGFGKSASSKVRTMYLLYVEALSVINTKASAAAGKAKAAAAARVAAERRRATRRSRRRSRRSRPSAPAGGLEGLNTPAGFSVRDLQEIAKLHAAWGGKMFEVLAASVCPTIFGHEVVKVGLALGLFGGARRGLARSKRADLHVLVVGDPGMGKSQMLTAVAGLAPRGVYVCGNTTSSSGLTVTVVKDAITGDFALEAGALVMGDQGVCCIDEFDKMNDKEHQALLEAMEQQTISVAKAGIVCSLSARTAVLAAANPVGGHYDQRKTVCENLKLPSNILSRFDLVFVLLDKPDSDMDRCSRCM